ncbi:hypothetical protein [Pelosinus propionicus]|uniref:Uncharacterized protein n=1 Tax=Pelosinus propionicus DSM 13327 TaxID=1123291 RepID=A0A1I4PLQ9_9FIRM|nr:hypothetical protein [Pelosinus propionicus]SFM28781.1 hypothetical protein SAMN04490355_10673 [Pelosinus propionicus DSM 13327]
MAVLWQALSNLMNNYPKWSLFILAMSAIAVVFGSTAYVYSSSVSAKEYINEKIQGKITKPVALYTSADQETLEKLTEVQNSISKLQQSLTNNSINKEQSAISGINDVDIKKWEISVVTGNKYNLKVKDKVIICNKTYGEHSPSAIFYVTAESPKRNDTSPEICMNQDSALAIDIPDPKFIGKFPVTIKKIELPTDKQ